VPASRPLGRPAKRARSGSGLRLAPGGLSEIAPTAAFSRDYSGYNAGELVVGVDGHLLGVNGWSNHLVWLEARGLELPKPLPAWFAWYLEHPFVAQIGVMLLLLPLIIASARNNLGR